MSGFGTRQSNRHTVIWRRQTHGRHFPATLAYHADARSKMQRAADERSWSFRRARVMHPSGAVLVCKSLLLVGFRPLTWERCISSPLPAPLYRASILRACLRPAAYPFGRTRRRQLPTKCVFCCVRHESSTTGGAPFRSRATLDDTKGGRSAFMLRLARKRRRRRGCWPCAILRSSANSEQHRKHQCVLAFPPRRCNLAGEQRGIPAHISAFRNSSARDAGSRIFTPDGLAWAAAWAGASGC
jgi:hypothetical protein